MTGDDVEGLAATTEAHLAGFLTEANDTGADNVELEYSTEGFMPGFYVFELRGSTAQRLEMLGSTSPCQTELSQNQMKLRRLACAQNQSFTVTCDWRQVVTDVGTSAWGPDRPTFTNGATCYLMHRDAGFVEEACRAGRLEFSSKHVIASAEYIPLIVAALSDDTNMFWDTECFFFRRARRPDKVYWYGYHQYRWQLLSSELAARHLALADFCRITGWGRHE